MNNDMKPENRIGRYLTGRMSDLEVKVFLCQLDREPALQRLMEEYDLARYLDGEIDDGDATKIEDKLQSDESLQGIAGGYGRLDAVFERIAGEEIDIDYDRQREDILDALEYNFIYRSRRWLVIGTVSAAAAVAAAIIVAITLFSRPPDVMPGPSGGGLPAGELAQVDSRLEYPAGIEDGSKVAEIDLVELEAEIIDRKEPDSFVAFLVSKRPELWSDRHMMMLIGG
jgi:hypothetical protein